MDPSSPDPYRLTDEDREAIAASTGFDEFDLLYNAVGSGIDLELDDVDIDAPFND